MATVEATDLERFTVVVDYLKNLTTLSTWAILLIAAFLEKLFKKPVSRGMVIFSLSGFILCVVSSVLVHTFMLLTGFGGNSQDRTSRAMIQIGVVAFILGVLGFLTGVVTLAIFAIRNLVIERPPEKSND